MHKCLQNLRLHRRHRNVNRPRDAESGETHGEKPPPNEAETASAPPLPIVASPVAPQPMTLALDTVLSHAPNSTTATTPPLPPLPPVPDSQFSPSVTPTATPQLPPPATTQELERPFSVEPTGHHAQGPRTTALSGPSHQQEASESFPGPGTLYKEKTGHEASASQLMAPSGRPVVEPAKSRGKRDLLVDVAQTALEIATILGGLDQRLQITLGFVNMFVDRAKQYAENKEALDKVRMSLIRIGNLLLAPGLKEGEGTERKRYEDLMNALRDAAETILGLKGRVEISGLLSAAKVFLEVKRTASEIQECLVTIDEALRTYELSLQQEIYTIVKGTREDIQKLLTMNSEQVAMADKNLLRLLRRGNDAEFKPDRLGCHKDTRAGVMQELHKWADDKSERLFWLSGTAGSGKSSIAQSFAIWLSGRVGGERMAGFFCSRRSLNASSRDCTMIIPTLVYQLAIGSNSEHFRAELTKQLKADDDIVTSTDVERQVQRLLVAPAGASNLTATIVIDALDECADRALTAQLLRCIIQRDILARIPGVKFFIASRPESHIRGALFGPSSTVKETLHTLDLDKEDGPKKTVKKDIELFVDAELRRMATDLRNDEDCNFNVPADWPSETDIAALVDKAAGSFIFASTAVKTLANYKVTCSSPVTRLKSLTREQGAHLPVGSVIDLYLEVLDVAFSKSDKEPRSILHEIFGLLVIAQEPLAIDTIHKILDREADEVSLLFTHLHSVLVIPSDTRRGIEFCHASFLEFLTDRKHDDKKNGRDQSYAIIAPNEHHLSVTRQCFKMISDEKKLKKNMYGRTRYSSNDAQKTAIDGAVRYSCLYWADHLLLGIPQDYERLSLPEDIPELLSNFLTSKQHLRWLEVLGGLGALHKGEQALRELRKRLISYFQQLNTEPHTGDVKESESIQALVQKSIDAASNGQHFILFAYDSIQESITHLYHSALPWTPLDVLGWYSVAGDLDKEARVIIGAQKVWTGNFRTIAMPGQVSTVGYSPSGKFLAAVGDGFTRLLHPGTGEENTVLGRAGPANGGKAWSLAFSSDDKLLAVAVNKYIQLWSISDSTCEPVKSTLNEGHESDIQNIMLHQNTLLSVDQTGHFSLWDIPIAAISDPATQIPIHPVSTDMLDPEHPNCYAPVCWLAGAEGRTIVVGTHEGYVQIRDTDIGAIEPSPASILRPQAEWDKNNESINVVASYKASPELGAIIAAGSRSGITVYDEKERKVIYCVSLESSVAMRSLAFSPGFNHRDDDFLIFTSSANVGLYHPHRGDNIVALTGHGGDVTSVTFSPSGQFITTGSDDKTVRFWKPSKTDLIRGDDHHASRITCAHFSRDGRYVVSGSADGEVKVWSVEYDRSPGSLQASWPGKGTPVIEAFFLSTEKNEYVFVWAETQRPYIIKWRTKPAPVTVEFIIHESLRYTAVRYNFPFDFVGGQLGFFSIHASAEEANKDYKLCCWELRRSTGEGVEVVELQLIAEGILLIDDDSDYVVRISTKLSSHSSKQLFLVVECASGKRNDATWPMDVKLFEGKPHELLFRTSPERERILSAPTPRTMARRVTFVPHESCCSQSQDNAWISNNHGTKILWIPPVHRGLGRWWKTRKLLLEGESGRLSVLDFKGVSLNIEDKL